MILAGNVETPFQPRSLPLCSPCSFVRGACPACPEPVGGVEFFFRSCCLGPLGISEGLPSVIREGLSLLIMSPYKSFRSNTYETLCKYSFQKTYTKAKSFRMRTYKKQGGRGYYC